MFLYEYLLINLVKTQTKPIGIFSFIVGVNVLSFVVVCAFLFIQASQGLRRAFNKWRMSFINAKESDVYIYAAVKQELTKLFEYCSGASVDVGKMSKYKFVQTLQSDLTAISMLRESDTLWTFLRPTAFQDALKMFGDATTEILTYKELEIAVAKYFMFRRKLRRVFNLIDDDDSDIIDEDEILNSVQDNYDVIRILASNQQLKALLEENNWKSMLTSVKSGEEGEVDFETFFAYCTFTNTDEFQKTEEDINFKGINKPISVKISDKSKVVPIETLGNDDGTSKIDTSPMMTSQARVQMRLLGARNTFNKQNQKLAEIQSKEAAILSQLGIDGMFVLL